MKKNILFKFIYILVIVSACLGLAYFALEETVPDLIPLIEKGNVEDIQAYLNDCGTFKGVLCTILLCMVQVWSLFIAGLPIQVAAGCVYGFFPAFLLCLLSSVAAQFVAILVWRKSGKRLEKWIPVDISKNVKFNEFLNSKAPPAYIIILACMIPVMPNGLIPLLASKMEISIKDFTLSVCVGNIVNVAVGCAVGNRIIQGDWVVVIVLFIFLFILFFVMWEMRNKILKVYYHITESE